MASVVRLSSHSISISSSMLTSLNSLPLALSANQKFDKKICSVAESSAGGGSVLAFRPRKQFLSFQVYAAVTETEPSKWWERSGGSNMVDIHSTQEFLGALSQAGERLVIAEFYGTWCASCRALFPKLCKTAEEHPEILFLKVDFDENKPMCKSMNVKVLPFFHFYRGADGLLESFSCSLTKFQKIKDAIQTHNTADGSIDLSKGVVNIRPEPSVVAIEKSTESTSA